MVILAQDGHRIKRARSGNWGAPLGSLLLLLSSAKEHSQTRLWHVQYDTWTSQWYTSYHTSLLQKRAVSLLGLPRLHCHEAKQEPVNRDDALDGTSSGLLLVGSQVFPHRHRHPPTGPY